MQGSMQFVILVVAVMASLGTALATSAVVLNLTMRLMGRFR